VVREATGDVSKLGDESKKASKDVDRVEDSLRKIKGDGFVDAANKANQFEKSLDGAKEKLEGLNAQAEKVRNVGAGMALAGAGGLALSKTFADAAAQGEGMEARLESILKQQQRMGDLDGLNKSIADVTVRGHFDDDDSIRDATVKLLSFNTQTKDTGELLELAARQARTMGSDVGSVAEALGKAYNTGSVGVLKKSGVTIDDSQIEKIKAAYAISKEIGQQTFMDTLGPAIKASTASIEDSLSKQQQAINDGKRAYDDFATAVGVGSQTAEGQMRNMTASVLGMVSQNPKLAAGAGYLLAWGSAGLTAAGGLISAGAQLVILTNGINTFRAARATQAAVDAAATAATSANTAAQVTNAGATATAGATALSSSLEFDALAAAETAAGVAAGGEAVSIGLAGAATATAGAAAGVAAVGFGALAAAIGLAAVALLGFWVAFQGSKDASSMSDENLRKKWGPLGNLWIKMSGSSNGNPDTGDNMDGGANMPDATSAATLPKAAAVAGPAATAALPATFAAAASTGTAGGVGATSAAGEHDPYEDQLRTLIRQKRDLKGKQNAAARDALTAQIDGLQDSQRQWKESHKNAVAAQKANDKLAKAADKQNDAHMRDTEELMKMDVDDRASDEVNALNDKLDAAKKANDTAQIKALTTQIGLAQAEEELQKSLLDASIEHDADHKKFLETAAMKRFDRQSKEARRAGGKAGEDDNGSKDHGAAIRAMLHGGSIAEHFMGLPPSMLHPVNALTPSGNQSVGRYGSGAASSRELSRSTSQQADGSYKTHLTVEVTTPYQGIAGLGDSR
jgi:hypothetical protein